MHRQNVFLSLPQFILASPFFSSMHIIFNFSVGTCMHHCLPFVPSMYSNSIFITFSCRLSCICKYAHDGFDCYMAFIWSTAFDCIMHTKWWLYTLQFTLAWPKNRHRPSLTIHSHLRGQFRILLFQMIKYLRRIWPNQSCIGNGLSSWYNTLCDHVYC